MKNFIINPAPQKTNEAVAPAPLSLEADIKNLSDPSFTMDRALIARLIQDQREAANPVRQDLVKDRFGGEPASEAATIAENAPENNQSITAEDEQKRPPLARMSVWSILWERAGQFESSMALAPFLAHLSHEAPSKGSVDMGAAIRFALMAGDKDEARRLLAGLRARALTPNSAEAKMLLGLVPYMLLLEAEAEGLSGLHWLERWLELRQKFGQTYSLGSSDQFHLAAPASGPNPEHNPEHSPEHNPEHSPEYNQGRGLQDLALFLSVAEALSLPVVDADWALLNDRDQSGGGPAFDDTSLQPTQLALWRALVKARYDGDRPAVFVNAALLIAPSQAAGLSPVLVSSSLVSLRQAGFEDLAWALAYEILLRAGI